VKTVLLSLCVSVLCGCGKKAASAAAGAAQPTPEQTAQIESEYLLPTNNGASAQAADAPRAQRPPNARQPAKPVQERLQGAIHAQLTLQLRMFIEKNGRVPENFSEFANTAMDTVPLAPDGMKFVIDPADRTVKVVKK